MGLRIGIAGGSVGGLFAAVLLGRQGHDVTVMERARHGLARRGAGLVVQEQVQRILRQVGLPQLAEQGVWADERIALNRAGDIASRDDSPQMQMSWDLLYDGFRQLMPPTRYLTGATVSEVRPQTEGAHIALEDGRRFDVDLLIGADGQASIVREAVNGDGARPTYAGYAAWRGLVPESAMPPDAARTLFGRMAFHMGHGSHALGYLVPGADGQTAVGERRYNWVWYHRIPADRLQTLLSFAHRPEAYSLGPGELPGDLRDALVADARHELPPPFAAAVAAEAQPFLQPIYDYETAHMVKGRIALLGDAAFIARPHTAMGVAKAAGDAMALASALAAHPLPEALSAYEHARLPQGRAVVDYGRRLGRSLAMSP
jgi:2-polyprenyl-6-methoxyphenol hydroxylase-like FAD-dependent oxidoreductase